MEPWGGDPRARTVKFLEKFSCKNFPEIWNFPMESYCVDPFGIFPYDLIFFCFSTSCTKLQVGNGSLSVSSYVARPYLAIGML